MLKYTIFIDRKIDKTFCSDRFDDSGWDRDHLVQFRYEFWSDIWLFDTLYRWQTSVLQYSKFSFLYLYYFIFIKCFIECLELTSE